MRISEEFEKDVLGPLLIESVTKLRITDREDILNIISGKQSTNKCYSITNIGENIISIDFPSDYFLAADYIIESCDVFGYDTISNVYDDKINIRIIK